MRINTIPVELLMDQHLRAEYLEIFGMMFTYYRRSILDRLSPFDWSKQPKKYTLGGGHAMFFYDKMAFVEKRWLDVRNECSKRGFATNINSLDYSRVRPGHLNDWTPDKEAMRVNLERIRQRISLKPSWYKFHGKNVDADELYKNLIEELKC